MVELNKDPVDEHKKQRIYVGGIDSRRGLTVTEVWQRLETKLRTNFVDGKLKTQWSDLYCGSCCLQFTATCDSMDQSPLAIIKSWFHNVMWKGCKLVVEEARPHFLDRLRLERTDRKNVGPSNVITTKNQDPRATIEIIESENIQQSRAAIEINEPENLHHPRATIEISESENLQHPRATIEMNEPENLTRYWKVKRGYSGEPARHVDTQSCDVTSWSMFVRIRQRHTKQQEKDRLRQIELSKRGVNMTVKEAQKRAYYNRSIRFRFPDDVNTPKHIFSVQNNVSHNKDTSPEQSIDGDDSSDDDSTDSLGNGSIVQNKIGTYVWSDDDSVTDKIREKGLLLDSNIENVTSSLHSSSHNQGKVAVGRGVYKWSDDEDSSTDDDTHIDLKRHPFRKQQDLDEFESALDLQESYTSNVSAALETVDTESNVDNYDLAQDVERNLLILAQLFPDTASKKSTAQHISDNVRKDVNEKNSSLAPQTSSGWGASGQMLRFDPSHPQSDLLRLDEEIPPIDHTITEADHSAVDNDIDQSKHSITEELAEINDDDATEGTVAKGVYEQQKLEQVFKEAREGVPIISSNRNDGGDASFSFGFELGDEVVHNEAAFSFNFGIPENRKNNTTTQGDSDIVVDRTHDDVTKTPREAENISSNRPRFLAFEFPNEDMLNEMVHHFLYKLNDGERIIRDVDEWRNDPTVKEKWLQERHTLTQDWKRKRKYALSKKQKRIRK